jgi:hypothetical protein
VHTNLDSDLGDVLACVADMKRNRPMAPALNFCFCERGSSLLLYLMLLSKYDFRQEICRACGFMQVMEKLIGKHGSRRA